MEFLAARCDCIVWRTLFFVLQGTAIECLFAFLPRRHAESPLRLETDLNKSIFSPLVYYDLNLLKERLEVYGQSGYDR